MYAIISELDAGTTKFIKNYWQRLCMLCGLKEIYHYPIPHFTWLSAEEMDVAQVSRLMDQIAAKREALTIQTFGLGIFTGQAPVLYLPIVKTDAVLQLHREIWERVQSCTSEIHKYYSPSLWIPHITLALKDLTRESLLCALTEIAFDPIELSCRAEKLALVAYEDETMGETLQVAPFTRR